LQKISFLKFKPGSPYFSRAASLLLLDIISRPMIENVLYLFIL